MNEDRKNEIVESACEAALFFTTLLINDVSRSEAATMTGTWLLSQRLKDESGDGEEWKDK